MTGGDPQEPPADHDVPPSLCTRLSEFVAAGRAWRDISLEWFCESGIPEHARHPSVRRVLAALEALDDVAVDEILGLERDLQIARQRRVELQKLYDGRLESMETLARAGGLGGGVRVIPPQDPPGTLRCTCPPAHKLVSWRGQVGHVAVPDDECPIHGVAPPTTTDYCRVCGESPDSASHWIGASSHPYEDPRK